MKIAIVEDKKTLSFSHDIRAAANNQTVTFDYEVLPDLENDNQTEALATAKAKDLKLKMKMFESGFLEDLQKPKKNRLEILKNSLEKKELAFENRLNVHFKDVKSANGQPLNDKRNGEKTIKRWEEQNNALRNLNKSVELTKRAIDKEERKAATVIYVTEQLPKEIIDLLESGVLIQWKKYPHTFFVKDVDKARISWDLKKHQVSHSYSQYLDAEQRKKFAQVFNNLQKILNEKKQR